MKEERIYDIAEVCRILGTTSRTLRFYEEKGIISSTLEGISLRRKYTSVQLENIRNVLVLRTLGLSVKSISELQSDRSDLKNAIISRRAEIYASIEDKLHEIDLLTGTLYDLEDGKNIFDLTREPSSAIADKERNELVATCLDYILSGDTDSLYTFISPRLEEYMPKTVYEKVRKDALIPLGDFISVEDTVADKDHPDRICCYVRYSRLGLKVTFVFHKEKIEGLWLGYYNTKEG